MKKPFLALSTLFLFFTPLAAQQKINFTRFVQFSLAPGISTNGMHPGGYSNYFSVNLTSGYSSANYLFELGVISNLNERETRGLQIGGLANLTGANAFAGLQWKEADKKKREGFEANLSGAQFSGMANIVLNNVFGWQATGGVNIAKGALQGFQLSGISNTVYKYSFAVQLAGVYNVSVESIDGVQLAGLFNITEGGLHGAQIGLWNKAGFMEGVNSFVNKNLTGLQLGIINSTKTMNGYQIGLINHSGQMQGTQIGLINIYRNGKTPETRDGTSIGLINIGSSGYAALYASDVFYMNIEIATGTVKNRRRNGDAREKQIQNSLLYSNDPGFLNNNQRWAIGYGIKKYFFNRSITPGRNKFNFFSLGVDWMHINHERNKFTKELSLLSRPTVAYGSKVHPRNRMCYFFGAISYNIYKSRSEKPLDALIHKGSLSSNQYWPGFSGGILIQ
jgi:hypothetical protein